MNTSKIPWILFDQAADDAAKAEQERQAAELKRQQDEAERKRIEEENKDKPDAKYVERLRREKAEAEAELKKLRDAQNDRERKELEEQKAHEKLADLEKKNRIKAEEERDAAIKSSNDRVLDAELKLLAIREGMVDLDFLALLDRSNITIDKDGVHGAEEAFKALKEAKPILFKAADVAATTTTGNRRQAKPGASETTTTKAKDAADMNDKEFGTAWGDIGKKKSA